MRTKQIEKIAIIIMTSTYFILVHSHEFSFSSGPIIVIIIIVGRSVQYFRRSGMTILCVNVKFIII